MMASGETVADFYAGKSVFITGGTGFLGKVLIQRLLHSCPKLDKIFILIKEKKNESPECRLQNIFNLPIFRKLAEDRGEDILKKVVTVVGDITEENLGISEEDEKTLLDKTAVVFHVAATVRFNEPLNKAMDINFEGTRRVLNLSKRMKFLEKFIYVSTAYANTNHDVIKEVVYPPPASYKDVYAALEGVGEYVVEIQKVLSDLPNTYVFTKALSENYIANNHGNIPTVIIRPSVVASSINEPQEGWIDNWFGATRILTEIGMGRLRVLYGSGSNVIDVIPVDYVVNLIIVAAAKCNRSNHVEVYNSCSSEINPVSLKQLTTSFIKGIVGLKLNPVPYPTITFTTSTFLIWFIIFLTQTVPAFIMDNFLRIIGRKPRYMRSKKLLEELLYTLAYFTNHSWTFCSTQTRSLFSSLTAADRDTFPFDPANIDWSQYLPVYINGIKNNLL